MICGRTWTIRPSVFHLKNYSRSRQRQLAFQVLDENDNSPIFVQTQPNVTVPEDAKVLLPIYRYFLLQKKFYSKYISPSQITKISVDLLTTSLTKKKERKEDLRKKNSFHHHQVGDRVATVRATDLDSGGIILNMSWDFSIKLFVVFFFII